MEKWLEKEKRRKETFPEQSRIPNRQHLSLDQKQSSARLGQFLAKHAEKLGGWTYDFVRRHWLGIVNFHLLVFVIGAIEAPLLLHLDFEWISKTIYGFYSFFCHQEKSRSFLLFGNQVAICSRCLSFYSSMLIFGLWVSLKRVKPLELKLALLLILPALVNVFLQILHILKSTNLIRVTTGLLLGMAVSLYLFPRAQKALQCLTTDGSHTSKNQARYR
jgi:uncharacterized membrane protein